MKKYCPLYKSFGSKINTVDTSKISYQKCYLFTVYSLYTKPVNCRIQKAMAMINLFFLCSMLKERKANIRRNIIEAL